jgi:transketolase
VSPTLHVSDSGTRWTVPDPRELALRIRLRAVRMVAPRGFGYLGQALWSAEQVAAVFARARPGVDRLVCSPGQYIIGPFAAAAELGLLEETALSSYGQNGSPFEAIGTERSPVVDYTCGSLGQGLSAAVGFAWGTGPRQPAGLAELGPSSTAATAARTPTSANSPPATGSP